MTFRDFKNSLSDKKPPDHLSDALKALWYDAKDDWDQAHVLAQRESDYTGAWVHGYLHRKEGDISNASYWYSRAGKPKPETSLEEEWENLVKALTERGQR